MVNCGTQTKSSGSGQGKETISFIVTNAMLW